MPLDFSTKVCQHNSCIGYAIPAAFRLEHTEYGVTYLCYNHPRLLYKYEADSEYTITRINRHTQPAQERG